MSNTINMKIQNSDFTFENSSVRILANRNLQEIKLPGSTIGPFKEGNEYDVEYWVACQLVKLGVARFGKKEVLDANRLYKIQWKERVQRIRQLSKLPDEFYPKLRRYLTGLQEELTQNQEKMQEYNKAKQVARDIIISRLKKIVSLASAPAQTQQILENLTREERFLYQKIYELVNQWQVEILKKREEED